MIILGLSIYAWITLLILIVVFGMMLFTKLPEDFVFLGAMAALYISGVLTADEALRSFSNIAVVVVALLFIIVSALVNTGVLQWIANNVLGKPKGLSVAIVKLMAPVSFLSMFLSDSAVVAMFIPAVLSWCKKIKKSPSKLMLPLGYASSLGGVCTLVGTPPNLLISQMYAKDSGYQMGIFTPLPIGLLCVVTGVLCIILAKKFLPKGRRAAGDVFDEVVDYTVELLVPTDCDCVGKTVSECGLNSLKDGNLIELMRFDKEKISPVSPDEFIFGGDRLVYSGQVEEILQLKKSKGLVNAVDHVFNVKEIDKSDSLQMGHVKFGSNLIGKRMCDIDFEKKKGFVTVAIARQGERINQNPREVILVAGDTLLLECSKGFVKNPESVESDLFITESAVIETGKKSILSSLLLVLMVLFPVFGLCTLLQSCFVASLLMLIFRCCTPQQARKSIDWPILTIFSCSVCIGTAIQKTGLAEVIAKSVLSLCGSSPMVALVLLFVITCIITEFVVNTAAAALMYPIAYSTAVSLGVSPMPFLITLMVAASASFASPVGSGPLMLVYGPGGYKFADYLKIGLPLIVVTMIVTLVVVPLIWPF